jgi:hypothetical protein
MILRSSEAGVSVGHRVPMEMKVIDLSTRVSLHDHKSESTNIHVLGACPNNHCSTLRDSDSTVGFEQVFSFLDQGQLENFKTSASASRRLRSISRRRADHLGGHCAYCSFSISPLWVCPINRLFRHDHHGEGSMTLMSRRPVEGIA